MPSYHRNIDSGSRNQLNKLILTVNHRSSMVCCRFVLCFLPTGLIRQSDKITIVERSKTLQYVINIIFGLGLHSRCGHESELLLNDNRNKTFRLTRVARSKGSFQLVIALIINSSNILAYTFSGLPFVSVSDGC